MTPLPSPMMATPARTRVQHQWQVRQELLRLHVACVRGVDLPVDRERQRAGQPPHRHRPSGAVAVIQERACARERIPGLVRCTYEAYL